MNVPPSELVIRPATVSDAVELARLLTALGHLSDAQAVASRWPDWSASGNIALVAARSNDTLAGVATLHKMVVLHRPRPVGRITALMVDTPLQGLGIGRALVAASEAFLGREGCGMLEITSHVSLTAAHAFYEHIGYEKTSFRLMKVLTPAD